MGSPISKKSRLFDLLIEFFSSFLKQRILNLTMEHNEDLSTSMLHVFSLKFNLIN